MRFARSTPRLGRWRAPLDGGSAGLRMGKAICGVRGVPPPPPLAPPWQGGKRKGRLPFTRGERKCCCIAVILSGLTAVRSARNLLHGLVCEDSCASILKHEIDLTPIWRALRDQPERVVLVLGTFLRLAVYAHGRSYWLDEASLAANAFDQAPLDFSQPLTGDQLAPFGFLIVVRAVVSILGPSPYVTRLLPLACGNAALFAFAVLARRILPRRAALVALALFAFSDDLIYYSSEFKPYSLDLAAGVAITLLACDAVAKPAAWRQAAGIALCADLRPGARLVPHSWSPAAGRALSSPLCWRAGTGTPWSGARSEWVGYSAFCWRIRRRARS